MTKDGLTEEEKRLIAERIAELLAHAPPMNEDQQQFARTLTARRQQAA